MNDILLEALRTTVLGMGIVFITLYVLSLILELMKVVFHQDKKESTKVQKSSNIIIEDETKKEAEIEVSESNNEELIAVISAALSAYLDRPISQIKIGTIKTIHKQTPVWGMASRLKNKF